MTDALGRCITRGSRVLLVGSNDERLLKRIAAAGASVHAVGAEDVSGVAADAHTLTPDQVVLAGGWVRSADPASLIRALTAAAPRAELVAVFRNASGAGNVIEAVAAGRSAGTLAEEEVTLALAAAGLSVSSRVGVQESAATVGAPVETALRSMLAQLNPSAQADWLVISAAPTAERAVTPPRPLQEGLLSVVIRSHTTARLELLDHAIFSLAGQSYHPLEIVLVTQDGAPEANAAFTRVLERHQRSGGYEFRVLAVPSKEDIRGRLLNEGIRAARGQYVAFLDDDDVVYPHHYSRLIAALQGGTAAWAVSRTRVARFGVDATGTLHCSAKFDLSPHQSFAVRDFLRTSFVAIHAYVVDRSRIGRFDLAFPEHVNRCEDYALLLRLVALFRPEFLPGPGSCEYRVREDGSNTNPLAGMPPEVRAREAIAWAASDAFLAQQKRELWTHLTLAELAGEGPASTTGGAETPPLRHQVVDALNRSLKKLVPGGHGRLKQLAGRLLRQ